MEILKQLKLDIACHSNSDHWNQFLDGFVANAVSDPVQAAIDDGTAVHDAAVIAYYEAKFGLSGDLEPGETLGTCTYCGDEDIPVYHVNIHLGYYACADCGVVI